MWKKKKNSINHQILKYFLIFSIIILGTLWLFQFLLFNSFYKNQKINDIKVVANKIYKNQNNENFEKIMNDIAFDKSVCIEITNQNYNIITSSDYFGKGCIVSPQSTYRYKFDFISSNQKTKAYTLTNEQFDNETLIYAMKLDNNKYAFINSTLEPIDGITFLIRKQLIVITILSLIISYILAYLMSKHLSKPIQEISQSAKELAKGNYQTKFKNHNILEIQELANTLNYAQQEIGKAEELRRALMANVSHDLKTPLTMIKAYAEIAKDLHQNNPEKQMEDMDTIISETNRLTILVDDILTLSKMESMKEELEIEKFDLIALINDIISGYKILQETEKYQFKFIHKDKEIWISADKKRLNQVIYNLVNNAINYTGKDNTVTIRITKNENVLVEIKDTGNGIQEEEIPYIWDKYYKNKKKHKRNRIGTGLGLSIVKKILEEHHYPYGVNSTTGKGTTFYFEIKEDLN